jgi:hypothetical protein
MTESEIRRAFSPSRHLSKKIIRFALDGDTQQLVNASLLFKLPFRAVRALIPNRIRKHLSKETEDQNGRPSIIRKWESKKMQMEKPIMPIDVGRFRWMASKTNVEIGKARKILGYEPMFSLMDGMARTREWATWAGLI